MKVCWVVNTILPVIAEANGRTFSNKEGWLDGLSRGLISHKKELAAGFKSDGKVSDFKLCVCFPIEKNKKLIKGSVEEYNIDYYGFPEDTANPHVYDEGLEEIFASILVEWQPDIVHIFGTEYPHALAMTRVFNDSKRMLVSVQGIISECGRKYMAGLPEKIRRRKTFRDRLKKDSVIAQQNKFITRGQYETEVIKKTGNIAGRTFWDKGVCAEINDKAKYHRLNETLRDVFYSEEWSYKDCNRHQIFVSQGNYPLKGLHFVLEAISDLKDKYPDMRLIVAGDRINSTETLKDKIKIGNYGKYLNELIEKYKLEKIVEFTGNIPADEIKLHMLNSNVMIMASSVENSSNSMGEAMLLGLPVISSNVGGLPSLMYENEGFYYKFGDAKELKETILGVFEDPDEAIARSARAKEHARKTHDSQENIKQLVSIYNEINLCV